MRVHSKTARVLCVTIIALIAVLSVNAKGVIRIWDNDANDNDWHNPLNWDPNGSPGDTDTLLVLSGHPEARADRADAIMINAGGAVIVSGSDASVATYNTLVGWFGEGAGELIVANGGTVTDKRAYIGGQWETCEGTVRIVGPGSCHVHSGGVTAGIHGRGVVEVKDGGSVVSGGTDIIGSSNGEGFITVRGTGSRWDSNMMLLGLPDGGTGHLIVCEGGVVSVTDELIIFAGELSGNGVVDGNVIVSGGVVSPGNSTGTLTIEGDYLQASTGSLQIELAGRDSNEFDRLHIIGNASLGGRLDISLIEAFMPEVGDTFPILEANSVTGVFDDENGTDFGGGVFLDVVYSSEQIILLTCMLADMDGSGKIDSDDINPFILAITDPNAYTATYGLDPNRVGDCDDSGKLDTDDINPFVALVIGGSSPAVPEPATLSLLAIGGIALIHPGRRHKHACKGPVGPLRF